MGDQMSILKLYVFETNKDYQLMIEYHQLQQSVFTPLYLWLAMNVLLRIKPAENGPSKPGLNTWCEASERSGFSGRVSTG